MADWATTGLGAGLIGRPKMSETWILKLGLSTLTELGPAIEIDTGDTLLLDRATAASKRLETPKKHIYFKI